LPEAIGLGVGQGRLVPSAWAASGGRFSLFFLFLKNKKKFQTVL